MPEHIREDESDLALVERARDGSERAFAELWRRHHGAVIAATRSFTGYDAEDITQEAFARVFAQIRDGEGPTVAFRAYLARTARNVAIDMARRGDAHAAGDDIDELAGARPDHSDAVMDNVALRSAFASLPTRWQEVLWYRDVEDLPVKECARFVGMSENATTALIKRAREGLKQAWIVANVDAGLGARTSAHGSSSGCGATCARSRRASTTRASAPTSRDAHRAPASRRSRTRSIARSRSCYLRSGGNRFLVFLPLAGITSPIEYWQGEGQTSKVQVWTPGALRP